MDERATSGLGDRHHASKPEPQVVEVDVLSAWCIRRASTIFSGLQGQKARLVDSVGFAGSRLVGTRSFPDAELSMWLLANLDTTTMTLRSLAGGGKLPARARDVHLGLGLPYHGIEVDDCSNVPAATMESIRAKLLLSNTCTMITTNLLEQILLKDYGDDMSASEEDAFMIAAVLYSMSCLYAVKSNPPSIPLGLLNYVANIANIKKVNWCGYILSIIKQAAISVQHHVRSGIPFFSIPGCMFWLQMYYLDNLDFGITRSPVVCVPRIADYSHGKVTKLISAATDDPVCGRFSTYAVFKLRSITEVGYSREEDDCVKNQTGRKRERTSHGILTEEMQQAKKRRINNPASFHDERAVLVNADPVAADFLAPKKKFIHTPSRFSREGLCHPTNSNASLSANLDVPGNMTMPSPSSHREYSTPIPNGLSMAVSTAFVPERPYNEVREDITVQNGQADMTDGPLNVDDQSIKQGDEGSGGSNMEAKGKLVVAAASTLIVVGDATSSFGPMGGTASHLVADEDASPVSCEYVPNMEGRREPATSKPTGRTRPNLNAALKKRLARNMKKSMDGLRQATLCSANGSLTLSSSRPESSSTRSGGGSGFPMSVSRSVVSADRRIQDQASSPSSDEAASLPIVISGSVGDAFSDDAAVAQDADAVHFLTISKGSNQQSPLLEALAAVGDVEAGEQQGGNMPLSGTLDPDVYPGSNVLDNPTEIAPRNRSGSRSLLDPVSAGLHLLAGVANRRYRIVFDKPDYKESPFDLGYNTALCDRTRSRRLLKAIYSMDPEKLGGVWYHNPTPWTISITGRQIEEQMGRQGHFSTDMFDGLMRLYQSLDDAAYGTERKRWRCFLPARFADVVLRGENYLEMEDIRGMFIGSHLNFDFEHVRKVKAPVWFEGRWTCYIWDMSAADLLVLDPTMMKRRVEVAEDFHSIPMKRLTHALVRCTKKFFRGWRATKKKSWVTSVDTGMTDGCRKYNSGVFTAHYARWYEGPSLLRPIASSGLFDTRTGLRYQLIMMGENSAELPDEFYSL